MTSSPTKILSRVIVTILLAGHCAFTRGVEASSDSSIVYVVHAVDTESDQLNDSIFNQELVLSNFGHDGGIATTFDSSWRNAHLDSYGTPPIFTWYLITHEAHCQSVQGCNAVPEVMLGNFYEQISSWGDETAWHYHHSDWTGNAWDRLYTFDGTVYRDKPDTELAVSQLAMLVFENQFFPTSFRAGWTWEITDFSNWLENLILYDYSNLWQNTPSGKNQWTPYNPSPDDFRSEGSMNRWVLKCKQGGLSQEDVNDAFELAQVEGKAIISYYSHSYHWSTLKADAEQIEEYLNTASLQYGIPFKYVGSKEAMQLWLNEPDVTPPTMTVTIANRTINVESNEDLFGPPFFAALYADGDYGGRLMDPDGRRKWSFDMVDFNAALAVIAMVDLAGNQTVSERFGDFNRCSVADPECGDTNGDGAGPNVADLSYLVSYFFRAGQTSCSLNSADVDGSGYVNVADITYLVENLFLGGPELNCP